MKRTYSINMVSVHREMIEARLAPFLKPDFG